ncbi:unnamed protein product [Trifolium pratense]|uniref:Uncharacterized protein n=1 Tax=Trifolium pratense TaxID=57577 RepID=A0ACB0L3S3_TRIPR|nr:unnamed protein product [Trifolium pratense]
MEMPAHRTWMYNRRIVGRKGYTAEFLQGLEEFLDFACQQPQYLNEGVISCPCKQCKNERHLTLKEVNIHIRQKGFTPGYWYWTSHGEEVPQTNLVVDMHSDEMPFSSQQDTGFDDADLNDQNFVQNEEVPTNMESTEFYDMPDSTQQPARSGYQNTPNMSAAIAMLSLQSKHNMSQDCFNDVIKFMRESSHIENEIPSYSRKTKRTLQPTKMSSKKKRAQTNAPLIIPSDTLQTYSNQATQPPSRTKPRTKLSQSRPTKPLTRLQLRTQSQFSHSQLPLQPQPTELQPQPQLGVQPQPTESRHRLRPQPTVPRPTEPQLRLQPQPTPPRPQPQLRLQPQPTQPRPQPQLRLQPQPTQPQPTPPRSQPQPQPQAQPIISQTIPTQVLQCQEFPMVNETPSSSSNHVSESNGNKIPILPEGDGFDQHRLVVKAIALIIRTNLEEGKPSWKQLSKKQRDSWFDIFKSKFTWPPQHKDLVRRNFEKRGSAKMIQLMQEARKDLDQKPIWMEERVWTQLKAHWESLEYKRKSEINKRNGESMAGASLHTGGSIPHHLHWKRMKEANGTDPSMAEFYFRTHRKKDQSWVGPCAESAYDKFERRKLELSSKIVSSENGGDNQPSIDMPSELDIWVDSVGTKKGRVFGLGSVNKKLVTSVKLSANSEDVNALRSQIHALNKSLQKQEQEKLEMKHELTETKQQVAALMQHLGFAASSSRPHSSPQDSNEIDNGDADDSDGDHLE